MSGWATHQAAYLAAKAAEDAFDAAHIDRPMTEYHAAATEDAKAAAWARVTDEMWDESDRLQADRYAAEDALMEIPAPDLAAFALKYLIAHGDGRQMDCWDGQLDSDARRLATPPTNATQWAEAEARLGAAKAAVDAHKGPDGKKWDALVAAFSKAELQLVAIPPETLPQAVRRIEVALFSGPLHEIDTDEVIADAVRLTEARHG